MASSVSYGVDQDTRFLRFIWCNTSNIIRAKAVIVNPACLDLDKLTQIGLLLSIKNFVSNYYSLVLLALIIKVNINF